MLSCFVFYQFVVSNNFHTKIKHSSSSYILGFKNKQVLSLLFYQYWASFFSSVIIVYSISIIFFFFGSTNWYILNFLFNFSNHSFLSFDFFNKILLIVFFSFAFFLKLGFTPLQLFKIEIYKSLPFISIFLYTTIYFFSYFFYFIFLNFFYFSSSWLIIWYIFFFFIVVGSFYSVSLLFDVSYLKAFFAYSTVINSISFSILFLVLIN